MKGGTSVVWRLVVTTLAIAIAFPAFGEPPHASKKIRTVPSYLSSSEIQAVNLYKRVLPTVVTVFASRSVFKREKGAGLQEEATVGSGVLISPESHVLTAAHVVDKADKIIVKTAEGKMREAELLFSESSADIALIKLVVQNEILPHAKLGDSDNLAVGQITYAIGSPYGLEHSFTMGHISGFREFSRLYDGTILAEFIQTDAAINMGNSGGPVFNSQGEVIGIASRIISVSGGSQGLGFAVTINTAKQLLALQDRVWIGIEGIFLNSEQIARLFNRELDGGLLIERVAKGSPADKAGLRGGSLPAKILNRDFLLGGDLIFQFGDQKACDVECLMAARKRMTHLDRVVVKFLRDGKVREAVIDISQSHRNFMKKE